MSRFHELLCGLAIFVIFPTVYLLPDILRVAGRSRYRWWLLLLFIVATMFLLPFVVPLQAERFSAATL
jgi:hypothetical protein